MFNCLMMTALAISPVMAVAGDLSVTVSNDLRCISSDGLPDHDTGSFPNRGNPHRISAQSVMFCVDATPEYSVAARKVLTTGITDRLGGGWL